MNGPFDDLVEQLEALAAELDDRAFELLRAAASEGRGRPVDDRRLTQARRAVEKAAHLLRSDGSIPAWSGDE
jgi:hypothetical protein